MKLELKNFLKNISYEDLELLTTENPETKKRHIQIMIDLCCLIGGKDTFTEKEFAQWESEAFVLIMLELFRRLELVVETKDGVFSKTEKGMKVDKLLREKGLYDNGNT